MKETVTAAIAICFGLSFLNLSYSSGQEFSTAGQDVSAQSAATENSAESAPLEPLQIKLSVSEVRLDVVVLDNKGNPVTDLKASDFEISQNGKRHNILSSVYVENQSDAAAQPFVQPSAPKKDVRNLPALPTAALKREDIRRTIVFVLDDYSMRSENAYYAKMALSNFVEKQMQPGDIVSILHTGQGSNALQMFLSDKNQLLARINALRLIGAPSDPNLDDSHLYRIYDNQLFTLSYSIRALKDMPGRKILIMMTTETSFSQPPVRVMSKSLIDRISFPDLYHEPFDRLADDALRAGVVVSFLNIGGLENTTKINEISYGVLNNRDIDPHFLVSDAEINVLREKGQSLSGILEEARVRRAVTTSIQTYLEEQVSDTYENARNARNLINPLPAKTGGVIIENSNFFLDGVGRDVDSLMQGYYLISYVPPEGTFSLGDKEIFNQVKVNVRRRNTTVYTRDGFYNRHESDKDADAPPAHPLQNAIFSPFLYADLDVNIAAGYARDAKAGYLVRSWIHLDPKDVKIVDTEDGGARIDLETVCLTSDINGVVQDLVDAKYTFNIEAEKKSENIAWIAKHGIRFAMLLPVKKTGSYYVRTAVRDTESDKIGSAYQYVEIPDLARGGQALSNIFMITSPDDINWMRSGITEEISGGIFFPTIQGEDVRSPALRTFMPGDDFYVLATLYNADVKAIARSEIELQSILYRDGNEFHSGDPVTITPDDVNGLDNSIQIMRRFILGSDTPSGEYVLQLVVTDKSNSRRQEGNASQTINFTVTEKQ